MSTLVSDYPAAFTAPPFGRPRWTIIPGQVHVERYDDEVEVVVEGMRELTHRLDRPLLVEDADRVLVCTDSPGDRYGRIIIITKED